MAATTLEHAPPKVMFEDKIRPIGHEFPACARCNNGMSSLDQIAAMFAHISGDLSKGRDGRFTERLLRGVANNNPDVFNYIDILNPSKPLKIDFDGREQEGYRVSVNRGLFRKWLNPWAAKQACGLWYFETGKAVSETDRVIVTWLTNDQLIFEGAPDSILTNLPNARGMHMGRRDFHRQFSYLFGLSNDHDFGAFFSVYQDSVGVLSVVVPDHMVSRYGSIISFGELYRVSARDGLQRCLSGPIAEFFPL